MYSGRNSIIEASFTSNQRTRIKVYLANQVFSSIQLLSPLEAGSKRTLSGDDTKNQRGSQAPESSKKSRTLNYSSIQSPSLVQLFVTPWTAACQASLSITNSGVHPNPCPLSRWCHPAISSSAVPFSSCPQSFPVSGSFPMSQLFTSGGQSIGVSASASVLPMNTQGWSPLGWTGWISLQSKGLSRVFSNTTVRKHQFFCAQLSL